MILHPHAQHAAEAAESAAAQNKFWEMHDYLFEHQRTLDGSHLLEYAKIVGTDKFKVDMSRHVFAPLIKKSPKGGIDSGIEGTPTFFINEIRYEDSWYLETFSGTLQRN